MRIRPLLTALALAGGLAVPQAASAAPPDPRTCTPAIEIVATPAQPAGLVDLGVVAVGSGQVVCTRDPLNSTVNELTNWWGHISTSIQVNGTTPSGCSTGPLTIVAAGPVLVLPIAQTCVIPVSDPRHLGTVSIVVHWATLERDTAGNVTYLCCDAREAFATPVGVEVG